MYIGITLYLIAFFLLAWWRLDRALLLLIVALPTYLIRFEVAGLPFTLLEAMILMTATVWFIKYFLPANRKFFQGGLHRPGGRINYPYSWEMILLVVISFIAAGIAGFTPGALGIWKAYFFEPVLLFIVLLNTFKNRTGLGQIIGAFALSVAAVSLFAIYQKISGQFIANPFWAATETRRVVSFFGYPNAVGLYLAPLSLILTGWLISIHKERAAALKTMLAGTILASWLAIYFAHSDGAIVAVAVGLVVLAGLTDRRARVAVLVVTVLAAAGLFFFQPASDPLIDKILLRDLSGEIRQQQWRETITMLQNGRILTGAGLDNYQESIGPYHQEGIFFNFDDRPNFDAVVWANPTLREIYWQPVEIYLYPHNIFLNFWSELGLAGLLLFLWLIVKTAVILWRLARRASNQKEKYLAAGLGAALAAIVVHGLVDVPYFKNDLAAMFWIVLALVAILNLTSGSRQTAALTKQ